MISKVILMMGQQRIFCPYHWQDYVTQFLDDLSLELPKILHLKIKYIVLLPKSFPCKAILVLTLTVRTLCYFRSAQQRSTASTRTCATSAAAPTSEDSSETAQKKCRRLSYQTLLLKSGLAAHCQGDQTQSPKVSQNCFSSFHQKNERFFCPFLKTAQNVG